VKQTAEGCRRKDTLRRSICYDIQGWKPFCSEVDGIGLRGSDDMGQDGVLLRVSGGVIVQGTYDTLVV
jgi:hypothetical protein